MIPSAQSDSNPSAPSRAMAAGEIVFLLAIFFIYAGWPTPDVNESHYLSKAKHYWDADWAAGDFFCESADAHQMFYWSCGWLTLLMPLPAVAWVGRLLTWTLLAWSWRRLSMACVPRAGWAVLSGTLMLCLLDRCQMAGEWIVGGFEAKGFAYVLVFLGLEALLRGRWNRVWPLLGAASAFHVLVGGWMVLAAGMAWLLSKPDRPTLRSMIAPLALGLLLALPGLLPALLLTLRADPEMVRPEADHAALRRLAAETGGGVAEPEKIVELCSAIEDRSIRIPDDVSEPLWDSKLVLALFVLMISMEWITRKVFGLW
ncbi:MAG: hypothetical protein IIA67_11095 [Planctomycetes bacterium]|nr:hypothetical protein [Planctomycetota bacterium]